MEWAKEQDYQRIDNADGSTTHKMPTYSAESGRFRVIDFGGISYLYNYEYQLPGMFVNDLGEPGSGVRRAQEYAAILQETFTHDHIMRESLAELDADDVE